MYPNKSFEWIHKFFKYENGILNLNNSLNQEDI